VVEISLVNYCRLGRRDELNEQMFDLAFYNCIQYKISEQNTISNCIAYFCNNRSTTLDLNYYYFQKNIKTLILKRKIVNFIL